MIHIPRPRKNLDGADRRALERRPTDRLEGALRNAQRYGHSDLASQIETILKERAGRPVTTKQESAARMRAAIQPRKKPEPHVETPEEKRIREEFFEANKHRLSEEVIKKYRLRG